MILIKHDEIQDHDIGIGQVVSFSEQRWYVDKYHPTALIPDSHRGAYRHIHVPHHWFFRIVRKFDGKYWAQGLDQYPMLEFHFHTDYCTCIRDIFIHQSGDTFEDKLNLMHESAIEYNNWRAFLASDEGKMILSLADHMGNWLF